MSNPLSKMLLEQTRPGQPVMAAQVTITQVTPLLITFNGATNIEPADKWSGCTYVLGEATALYTNPGIPIVLPNG